MTLLADIRAIVGAPGLITGKDVATCPADWMGHDPCEAMAIVRPGSAAELSAVMKICHAARQPVVPAGGLTGLVHGAKAESGELLISLQRMRAIENVDSIGRTMTVEAGVPLQAVHEAAAEHALIYGVDLGSRGSCTIGGNISTNAGGNTVIRYGMTRDNVLGLEAVLADGTVISSMNTLLKNNTAYDLKQLFIGSEGTLGIVTRAVLKLHAAPASQSTAIVAIDGFDNLANFFSHVGARLCGLLQSFEVMWNNYYTVIAVDSGRHKPPLGEGHDFYVIVEAAGNDPQADEALFADVLGAALEKALAVDVAIASSKSQRAAIWAIREDVDGQVKALMPAVPFDVSLPILHMREYIEGLEKSLPVICGQESMMVVYGHIGDNNLHLTVAPRPWSDEARQRVEEMVYRPLAALGGSVSAEHCIGLDKRKWLPLSRTADELALMRRLKSSLDPYVLLNRGKVL